MIRRILVFSAVFFVCPWGRVSEAQPFSVTAAGTSISDNAVSIVPLLLPTGFDRIEQLELEISGLTHTQPADLDFYLVNPFGMTAELMSDRGDAMAIASVNLTFNDVAVGVPSQDGPIVSGLYRPEGLHLGTDGGLSPLGLNGSGSDSWILLVIDDAVGGAGAFDSFTLRGVAVPQAVPAVSTWGLVILTLVGLVAGTFIFRTSVGRLA